MTILRSPGYPGISLKQAVVLVEKLFNSNRTNAVDREAAAKDMGFAGITGSSTKAMADLAHFGLIEKAGKGGIRVTQRAVQILHGDPPERVSALHEAASSPALFASLRAHFADGMPSANALNSYLMRQGFVNAAIPMVVNSYLETSRYLQELTVSESNGAIAPGGPESALPEVAVQKSPLADLGGARLGDLVQWESGGALQFKTPQRVRWVSDDGQWLAVDGSEAGIPMSEVNVRERAAPLPPTVPLEKTTVSQEMARAPGVGPASAAQIANLPPTGWTQAVFPLADGPVFLNFPEHLTADGYDELKEYLGIFLRRAHRAKQQQEAASGSSKSYGNDPDYGKF